MKLFRLLLTAMVLAFPLTSLAGEMLPFQRGTWSSLKAGAAGRPTVVHFWSLTCAPCLAELPQWAAFRRQHPKIGLILVSTDPLAQSARLSQVLGRAGLSDVPSWAFADSFAERLRFEIDPEWGGELPHTGRIDRHGNVGFMTGSLSEDGVLGWLKEVEDDGHARP
jgi:thiol-disulfide isomerase/thioredoxin